MAKGISNTSCALEYLKMTKLEKEFVFKLKAIGLPDPVNEYRFHPVRRWRFDFAYPEQKIAFEVEGGTWNGGRHNRGSGYEKDAEKYNQAAVLGWQVYRFTGGMIRDERSTEILEQVKLILKG